MRACAVHRLIRNATANALQAVASALLILVLYRYISASIGAGLFGVWSVLLATASASRLADLGLGSSVTRFVARDLAQAKPVHAAAVIDTVTLTLMGTMLAAVAAAYPLLSLALPHLFTGKYLDHAYALLPWALTSFWITSIGGVQLSALDGAQRMGARSILVLSAQGIMTGLAFALVPSAGLIGLAAAQLVQGILIASFGRILATRSVPGLHLVPGRWSWQTLREMLGYSIHLQVAGVATILVEPLSKAMMARFGGPAVAGYFEFAYQAALRVRSVIVGANQAIIPLVAELQEKARDSLERLYRSNLRVLVPSTGVVFSLLLSWSGALSVVLLGRQEASFVRLLVAVTVALFSNMIVTPIYLANVGTGHVRFNTASQIGTAVINAVSGMVLGSSFGAAGVAAAYALSITAGSAILLLGPVGGSFRHLFTSVLRENWVLAVAAPLSVVTLLVTQPFARPLSADRLSLGVLLPLVLLGGAAAVHPVGRQLLSRVLARRPRAVRRTS